MRHEINIKYLAVQLEQQLIEKGYLLSYISFSYSDRDWCISGLLSTNSCGIVGAHLQ